MMRPGKFLEKIDASGTVSAQSHMYNFGAENPMPKAIKSYACGNDSESLTFRYLKSDWFSAISGIICRMVHYRNA